ncbi:MULTISPECIES: KH domain-containing protein [Dethiosulfovibrio]|uniref:KH domain-containing protein n=2 Tax=Dethiosulfovibrio TaxID=47054 RepID=A0ABS9EJK1_9BACT|nr:MULTISPECIES: KH domain-containing protein [Dethiosulfovibrio]MCF4112917.1 KH domain-containing protein [Dethiosulfovibrio russensis]MCF4141381.1 KH domain-containing protein [Dethiosulfovibrio marinus]MCF4144336.1 KH domain-containing protein [Dethiosulfovibrio acidaminovorans]MEA3284556.1 KH domain-containing protein [Synergistota bacterium]
MPDYGALVEYVARALVTKPEMVQVSSQTVEDGTVKVLVEVDSDDIGRMIGRRGATINAIRQVVRAAAVKSSERVDVDVRED